MKSSSEADRMTRPAERLSPDRQLSRQDIDCLKEAFKLFDCDRDGEITVSELGKVGTGILDTLMWQQSILRVFHIPQLLIAQSTMTNRVSGTQSVYCFVLMTCLDLLYFKAICSIKISRLYYPGLMGMSRESDIFRAMSKLLKVV